MTPHPKGGNVGDAMRCRAATAGDRPASWRRAFKGFAHGSPYVVADQESEAGIPFIQLRRIGLTWSVAPGR